MPKERRLFTEGYGKMRLKAVSGTMLTLLLFGILALAFEIQPVKASGTIYIRADGSVDPPTANITTLDHITYNFTGNINDEIVVQRSNITINGNGYSVEGNGTYYGFRIDYENNVTIKNTNIRNFDYGISVVYGHHNTISRNNITGNNAVGIRLSSESSYNTISHNNIIDNLMGIVLRHSSYNTISENNLETNVLGITLTFSSNNTVTKNNVENNGIGVMFRESSSYNKLYHNNFTENAEQVSITSSCTNLWDDGYPSGGNRWSDFEDKYPLKDVYKGPKQDEPGKDGFWDESYVMDWNNIDHYPIIPEFSPFLILPLFMITTLVAVIVYRRRHST